MKVSIIDGELGVRLNLNNKQREFQAYITRSNGKAFAEALLDVINGKTDHFFMEMPEVEEGMPERIF